MGSGRERETDVAQAVAARRYVGVGPAGLGPAGLQRVDIYKSHNYRRGCDTGEKKEGRACLN